jgi:hypothetical protein
MLSELPKGDANSVGHVEAPGVSGIRPGVARQSGERRLVQRPHCTCMRLIDGDAVCASRRVKVFEVNRELVDRGLRQIHAGSRRVALHDLAPVIE